MNFMWRHQTKSQQFLPNKSIIYLTFSDIFTWGLYSIVTALTGIYLSTKLGTDAAQIVGIGMGIYMLSRGVFQIPIGLITDRIRHDKDEIVLLMLGSVLMGMPFLFYPLITHQYFFYFLQFIFGIGTAMNLISWRKLFARNLDSHKEGLEYGEYGTVMSFSIAFFSVLAGVMANINQYYFNWVMVSAGILMMLGGIWGGLIFTIKGRKSRNM